jgi:hypothetical protein
MSRVTPEEVKAIIDTDLSDPVIQIWIDAANTIVTANAECIGGDEALLTQVELFLSAHNVGMLDSDIRNQIKKEGPDGFQTEYMQSANVSDELINSTVYGQQANRLSNGCLANVDDRAVTFFTV